MKVGLQKPDKISNFTFDSGEGVETLLNEFFNTRSESIC